MGIFTSEKTKIKREEEIRKFTNLSKVKIGARIKFNTEPSTDTISKIYFADVINNRPDDRKIFVKVPYTYGSDERVYSYDDPVFINFNVLNVFETPAEKRDKKLSKIE